MKFKLKSDSLELIVFVTQEMNPPLLMDKSIGVPDDEIIFDVYESSFIWSKLVTSGSTTLWLYFKLKLNSFKSI